MEENTDSRLTDCDFCINCNTVLLQASNKVSKIFRTIASQPRLVKHTDIANEDETETFKTEVSLAKAISITFKVNDMMDVSRSRKGNHTTETHFVCEKCGKLLETAYNAIQDFMELTRRGSVLMDKLKTKSVSLSPLKSVPKKSSSNSSTSTLKRSRKLKGKISKNKKDADNQHQRNGQGINKQSQLSPAKEIESGSSNSARQTIDNLHQPKEHVLGNSQSFVNISLNFCTLCDLELDQSEYQDHLKLHEDEEVGETEINHENIDYKFDLAEHDTSIEVIKCKFCGDENSSNFEELKEHYSKEHSLVSILTEHGIQEEGKSCELSNDLEKNDLSIGSVSTSGRLIFHCNVCNKRFIRHDHIKLHLRTHTGEKPFLCKVIGCEKSFSDPRGLAYHEITHSDARPYCCKFCGMTFKRLHHLNDHEKNHSEVPPRPFLCQFCDKAFKHKKHLNSHIIIHRGTKEHQCNLCLKFFNRKDNLQQHLRKVHPKLSVSDHIENDLQENEATNITRKSMLKRVGVVASTGTGVTSAFTSSSSTSTTVFQSSTATFTTGTIGSELTSVLAPPPTSFTSIINSTNVTTVTIPVSDTIATDHIQNSIDQLVHLHNSA